VLGLGGWFGSVLIWSRRCPASHWTTNASPFIDIARERQVGDRSAATTAKKTLEARPSTG